MRPVNQQARDRLNTILSRQAPTTAASLAQALAVSVSSIHRIAHEQQDIVQQGITKNTKYALRRPLRGLAQPIPIYRIDALGHDHHLGNLELIAPQGALLPLENIGWPTERKHQGWWGGLPYPIYDMRPQGFLGRNLAHAISQDFAVPENPEKWSDDDIAYVLSLRGTDSPGNLIIGNTAYQRWLASKNSAQVTLKSDELTNAYPMLAQQATSYGHAGSSAGGEFPKFTTSRYLDSAKTPHVIVKFSGADQSTAVQRWADLLTCEHLALTTLAQYTHIQTAKSRIIQAQSRTFLEVERFDRMGEYGRLPIISLDSIANAFIGEDASWPHLTEKLISLKLAEQNMLNDVLVIWWFGKLIVNSDMHLGNLSFTFNMEKPSTLQLSPVYDMLPMRYAPLSGGEVPIRNYLVSLPLPQEQPAWLTAAKAALAFWQTASQDTRISQNFRSICEENHQMLYAKIQS
jgi:HipA-like protein